MNQFIATVIVLIFVAQPIAQSVLETKNNRNISKFTTTVNYAKEQAKQQGYFTPEILDDLSEQLSAQFEVEEGDLEFKVTTTPKYRLNIFDDREMIDYSIGVPIEKIIAGNHIWGIADEENKTVYYIRGSVASERLLE